MVQGPRSRTNSARTYLVMFPPGPTLQLKPPSSIRTSEAFQNIEIIRFRSPLKTHLQSPSRRPKQTKSSFHRSPFPNRRPSHVHVWLYSSQNTELCLWSVSVNERRYIGAVGRWIAGVRMSCDPLYLLVHFNVQF